VPGDHLKHCFLNDFKVSFEDLNHRFFDIIEIAFSAVHNAENELLLPCNYEKNHFFNFYRVAF